MVNFDEVLEQCPFLRDAINQHISNEIAKVEEVKDAKIQELETTVQQQDNAIMELTAAILMGGM